MSRQEIVRKPSTTDTANTEVPVQDHGSIQDILSSSTHSVQSVFVHVIASDRYGFCIYECEISPEDTCSAALAKVRNVVLAAQNSIWDKLRRLLAHLLFTNIIGIAEFEQAHGVVDDTEGTNHPIRVIVRESYPDAHLQLTWWTSSAGCGAFVSSTIGRDVRSISATGRPLAIMLKRRLSRVRAALLASLIMIGVLLISYGVGTKLGWQLGLGVVAALYAFITAVQASTWLVEKSLRGVLS